MTDKRRVLKEFEWFEVQTKVRQIIGEVLQPIEKKIMFNASSISRLDLKGKEEQQKIEYITKMVHNDPEIFEHGVFSSIEQKIQDANIHISQLQSKIVILEQFIDNKIQISDRQIEESQEAIKGVNEFKQYLKRELDSQNDKLVKSMQNLFSNFDSINQDISSLTLNLESIKSQNLILSSKIDTSEVELNETKATVTKALEEFSFTLKEIKLTGDMNVRDIDFMQEEIKRVDKFQKYTKQLQEHIRVLSSEISNMEYKMEVVHPMIGLAQIYQFAHHFLPPLLHNNISIYFYNEYRHLIQEIVDNEVDKKKLGESKRKTLSFLKETHKQATKKVFKLKKDYFRCQGVDLDELSHDKRQEMLDNLILKEQFGEAALFGSQNSSRNKQKEQNSSTVEVQKERLSLMAEIQDKVQIEMKDFRKYILSMQDLMKRQLDDIEKKVEDCEDKCNNNEIEAELQKKYCQSLEQTNSNHLNELKTELTKFQKCLQKTQSALRMFQEIEKQDENDRQKIALLGVRESHRDQIKEYQESLTQRKSPVELKTDCLSCSGNANYYNQFFKMACLTYASSPIRLNNQVYERFELLQMVQKELQEVNRTLLKKEDCFKKHDSEQKNSQKMSRYESNQIMRDPSRQLRSASDSFMIRNVSSSQDPTPRRKDRDIDVPRVIGSQELASELMEKKRSQICNRRKDMGYRQFKARRESNIKDRSQYMINVTGFFSQLKKQHQPHMK